MIKPDRPLDETQRLKALYSLNILDTPIDEHFDRLTRMAKRIFDVPVALVTLIDKERQWVKSFAGLNMGNVDRDVSFCGHAILGDEVFVIPDMTQDDRFIDNPMVIDPETNVHFYAGCPIKSSGGMKLGTLCVLDNKPRKFNLDDQENLKDLATMVEREFSALEMATSDSLTGLLNRRGFMMLAESNLKLAKREHIAMSCVFLDLDNFKMINDEFGHSEGDTVLKDFSDLLKDHLRDSDACARLGGDEFVALLMNSDQDNSLEIVERIKESLWAYNAKRQSSYNVDFSYGVIQYNEDAHESLESLISIGDELMYEMKKSK